MNTENKEPYTPQPKRPEGFEEPDRFARMEKKGKKDALKLTAAAAGLAVVAGGIGFAQEAQRDQVKQDAKDAYIQSQEFNNLVDQASHKIVIEGGTKIVDFTIPKNGGVYGSVENAISKMDLSSLIPDGNADKASYTLIQSSKDQEDDNKLFQPGDKFELTAVDLDGDGQNELIVHPAPSDSKN